MSWNGRKIGGAIGAVTALSSLIGGGMATLAYGMLHHPAPSEPIAITCDPDAPELTRGTPLKVLVWNIQFGAGRAQKFFYDGGDAVSVSSGEVDATLSDIVDAVRHHDPDIILWQEVDRSSRRTGFVDQYERLLTALRYPCHASTPYHRAPYIPSPAHEHLGRVDMHLGVFSRYRLDRGTRWQLALLDESWLRQQFNLRRALMEVRVPISGGGEFVLFNTHLSAFSKGDGTLSRQMTTIEEHIDAAAQTPWILAGDFNSLPPGDEPSRLPNGAAFYGDSNSPIARLFERSQPAVPAREMVDDPQPWRTYLPFGSDTADRTLDYVFYGSGIEPRSFSVDSSQHHQSDHLPLIATLTIQ